MEKYSLDVDECCRDEESPIRGVYLSSETIDLIRIVRCESVEQLVDFVENCEQLKGKEFDFENSGNIEDLKKEIFTAYQSTFVPIEKWAISQKSVIVNILEHSGIPEDKIKEYTSIVQTRGLKGLGEVIANENPEEYEKFAKSQHRFMATERDQIMSVPYDDIVQESNDIQEWNTYLITSGRYYDVTNSFYREDMDYPGKENENELYQKKYDFYQAKRDLDFCRDSGKQARFHALLDKQTLEKNMAGVSKTQVMSELKAYVEASIDFINEYNAQNKIKGENGEEKSVIQYVDIFNEIVSFDKVPVNGKEGQYVNEWQQKYGITLEDIVEIFQYAIDNKPEGVMYVYNEPFLEDEERRNAVLEVYEKIDEMAPGLLDVLGTQMHLAIDPDKDPEKDPDRETDDISYKGKMENCMRDLGDFQKKTGAKILISEFDVCIASDKMFDKDGTQRKISPKKRQTFVRMLSDIIRKSGISLCGEMYWTVIDRVSPDVQRTNVETYRAKDFCRKLNNLVTGVKGSIESLAKHPFLRPGQSEKLKKIYAKNPEQLMGFEVKESKREILTSRHSGLYSYEGIEVEQQTPTADVRNDTTQEIPTDSSNREITFQEVCAATEREYFENMEDGDKSAQFVEHGVEQMELEKNGQDDPLRRRGGNPV